MAVRLTACAACAQQLTGWDPATTAGLVIVASVVARLLFMQGVRWAEAHREKKEPPAPPSV